MWPQINFKADLSAIAYNAQLLHKHLYRNLSIAVIDPFQDYLIMAIVTINIINHTTNCATLIMGFLC